MEEVKKPSGSGDDKPFKDQLLEFLIKLFPITQVAKQISSFIQRIAMLPQARERRHIDNMKEYLDAVAATLEELRRSGVSEADIQKMAVELAVPLIKANMNAMILLRQIDRAGVITQGGTPPPP